jgi:hypothetical protein
MLMKPLNFFIIYHDQLFQENTSGFPADFDAFTWVAVNEKIPKPFPEWNKTSVLKEYEMK